jgi:diacylglycerol kinase (ATP)
MKANLETLPGAARRVLIAVNPKAGDGSRQKAVAELTSLLTARGLTVEVFHSLDELGAAAHAVFPTGELRAVVAAGGDGTAAEIVNRIPQGAPLAVFPLGTENLLAGFLEIKHDAAALCEIIAVGRTIQLDAGSANGRLFLLMTGIGLDAEVVNRLHAARVGHISRWTYLKPILQSIWNYEYPELRVFGDWVADEQSDSPTQSPTEPIICRYAFIFNVPRYGANLKFIPAADSSDGLLDLITFQQGGLISGLKYVSAVYFERHRASPHVTVRKARRIRVESSVPVPYQIDGDPGGMLPVEIEVLPGRLRVLVAETFATSANSPSAASATDEGSGTP